MSQPPGRLPGLSAIVCFSYAVVHIWWAVDGVPEFMSGGESVYISNDWVPVVPSLAAAITCLAIGTFRRRGAPAKARWWNASVGLAAGALMVLYCFLFWIGLVMLFMVPFGVPMTEPGLFVVRAVGVFGGILTLWCVRAEFRSIRLGCERCGRRHGTSPEGRIDPSPWWAYAGAYLAVLGTAARFSRVFDQGESLFDGPGGIGFQAFVIGMAVAGTLLPLALVHRWGRIWPAWVVPLAGRDVPRWLVLGAGVAMGVGLTSYFGVFGIAAIAAGDARGAELEISGYTAWGVGLLIASASYYRLTKPGCSGEEGGAPGGPGLVLRSRLAS